MIFVTVGTQLPFDRLITAVDAWAGRSGRREMFAQIGNTAYCPQHIEWKRFIDADECRRRVAEAELVVAHAGMGSIITALELGKPIIVMPRRADLTEHRNDHQLATAKQFIAQGRISVAYDAEELCAKLDNQQLIPKVARVSDRASQPLLKVLSAFVDRPVMRSVPGHDVRAAANADGMLVHIDREVAGTLS